MNYHTFLGLRNEEKAYHTLTNGNYRGTNQEGDDIYQLYDFWVSVQENTKGFYYEACSTQPKFTASDFLRAQEL